MRLKLTDTTILNLKPQTPQLDVWDTLLPSFGVRVGLRRKTFIVMHGVPRKREVLGHWPTTKLSEARDRARDILRAPFRASRSIAAKAAVDEYLRSIQTRPRTASEYERLLKKYLPEKPLAAILPREILAVTDKLLKTPTECRHTHVAMQTFFNWCVPRYLSQSPMAGLRAPTKPNKRTRVLSYEELGKVWRASSIMGEFGSIIKLCILTGQRRSEVAAMKKEWMTTQTLVIPANITKNKREHKLPLSSSMMIYLKALNSPRVNWGRKKRELDKLSGVTNYVIHDLRRTFATNLGELLVSPHVIERLLNHAAPQSLGGSLGTIYNRHHYLSEMKSALELYENELHKRGVIS